MSVEQGHRAWQVHAEGRLDAARLASDLGTVREGGGGPTYVWVHQPTPDDDAVATAAGLRVERDLHQLRIPLPADPTDLETRPFVPGQDDEAWLAVNNRAFDWHPEQGGWTLDQLRERQAEPWFDPRGFLLHERDGRLAGFCWTKVHDEPERLGEIYVIAADPDFHGLGLGRALTLAGLQWLHRERGITTGMLYVDGGNTAARGLYAALGFHEHSVDRAYYGEIDG